MKRYNDVKLQAAYENACDCLYYGYGKKVWNNAKDVLSSGERYEI